MRLTERDKNTVGRGDKAPEKKHGNQRTQGSVVRGLFGLTHSNLLIVVNSAESMTIFTHNKKQAV